MILVHLDGEKILYKVLKISSLCKKSLNFSVARLLFVLEADLWHGDKKKR